MGGGSEGRWLCIVSTTISCISQIKSIRFITEPNIKRINYINSTNALYYWMIFLFFYYIKLCLGNVHEIQITTKKSPIKGDSKLSDILVEIFDVLISHHIYLFSTDIEHNERFSHRLSLIVPVKFVLCKHQ